MLHRRSVHLPVCLSLSLPLSICLSVSLSICLFAYLSVPFGTLLVCPSAGRLRLLSRLASAGDCRRRLLLPPLLLLLLPFVFLLDDMQNSPFTEQQHTYIHLNIDWHSSISHTREFHCQLLLFLLHLQFRRVAPLIKIVLWNISNISNAHEQCWRVCRTFWIFFIKFCK